MACSLAAAAAALVQKVAETVVATPRGGGEKDGEEKEGGSPQQVTLELAAQAVVIEPLHALGGEGRPGHRCRPAGLTERSP